MVSIVSGLESVSRVMHFALVDLGQVADIAARQRRAAEQPGTFGDSRVFILEVLPSHHGRLSRPDMPTTSALCPRRLLRMVAIGCLIDVDHFSRCYSR